MKKCKYYDKKIEYAHMELTDGKMFLIAAEELTVYDKYLRYPISMIEVSKLLNRKVIP